MPVIEKHYIDENKTLEEVGQIMEAEYGLVSSTQVFKTRLKAAGIRKNLTVQQKLRILNSDQGSDNTALPPPDPRRLRRPIRSGGKRLFLQANSTKSLAPDFNSCLALRLFWSSTEGRTTEEVLSVVKVYYQQFIEVTDASTEQYSMGYNFNIFRRALSQTRRYDNSSLLPRDPTMLNKACDQASDILETPREAVVLFAAYFSRTLWEHFPAARLVTMRFFIARANVNATTRDVARLLMAMVDPETSNTIGSVFLTFTSEMARSCSHNGSERFIEYLMDLRALAIQLHRPPGPDSGLIVEEMMRVEQDMPLIKRARLLYARAYMCFREKLYSGVKKWCGETLRLVQGMKSFWRIERGCLFQLGKIHDEDEEAVEAAASYRKGIAISLDPEVHPRLLQSDRFITLEFAARLKKIYLEKQMDEEVVQLEIDFGAILDKYQDEFKGMSGHAAQ